MSKLHRTKKTILEILSRKNKTLTDISRELKLAPSTVNQHLKELIGAGAIKLANDQHSRKWKYYEYNNSFGQGTSINML
jgi:predicted ArsR family transcriptional regulator